MGFFEKKHHKVIYKLRKERKEIEDQLWFYLSSNIHLLSTEIINCFKLKHLKILLGLLATFCPYDFY